MRFLESPPAPSTPTVSGRVVERQTYQYEEYDLEEIFRCHVGYPSILPCDCYDPVKVGGVPEMN